MVAKITEVNEFVMKKYYYLLNKVTVYANKNRVSVIENLLFDSIKDLIMNDKDILNCLQQEYCLLYGNFNNGYLCYEIIPEELWKPLVKKLIVLL